MNNIEKAMNSDNCDSFFHSKYTVARRARAEIDLEYFLCCHNSLQKDCQVNIEKTLQECVPL